MLAMTRSARAGNVALGTTLSERDGPGTAMRTNASAGGPAEGNPTEWRPRA